MAPILTEEEAALDPYGLLELDKEATEKDIQRSYRKKSLKCHPDRNPTPEAAIQFRQISVALEILLNPNKRSYIDNKLESDRIKKERYAQSDKKRKEMIDALQAREEEAKKAKIQQAEKRKQQAEEESIKDAGKRMLEEAQKRAAAVAAASTKKSTNASLNADIRTNGYTSSDTPLVVHKQPEITPEDLTLILIFPSSSSSSSSAISSSSLQTILESKYGPISHCVLTEPPSLPPLEGKKKKKGKKAVIEFEKGNWGGCWSCWKDHSTDSSGKALEKGIKVKWVKGEVPNWIEWADNYQQRNNGNVDSNGLNQSNGTFLPSTTATTTTTTTTTTNTNLPSTSTFTVPPSFESAPDFNAGGLTMSELLSSHNKRKQDTLNEKKRNDEFESMTLLRMRQLERERLEAKIREEEREEED